MDVFQTYTFAELAPSGPGAPAGGLALPVQILGTGRERRTEASYRWDNRAHHRRPYHVLQYTTAGRGWLRWNGVTRAVGPGELFAASWDGEFEYFHNGTDGPWEFLWVILEGPMADQVLARSPRPVVRLGLEATPVLLLENFLRRLARQDGWDRYALSAVGYELCLGLVRETEATGLTAGDGAAREAEAWVLAHPAEADCRGLAARFGYNPKYFAEFFRRHTGRTPQAFVRDTKLRYACLLLSGTAMSIGAISAELGFAEDTYFSRLFRRHVGQSPGDYRRTHRDPLLSDKLVALRPSSS